MCIKDSPHYKNYTILYNIFHNAEIHAQKVYNNNLERFYSTA